MNEEKLRIIDVGSEEQSISLKEDNIIQLPEIKDEKVIDTIKENKDKIINMLPLWSIEPPIEIRRGE